MKVDGILNVLLFFFMKLHASAAAGIAIGSACDKNDAVGSNANLKCATDVEAAAICETIGGNTKCIVPVPDAGDVCDEAAHKYCTHADGHKCKDGKCIVPVPNAGGDCNDGEHKYCTHADGHICQAGKCRIKHGGTGCANGDNANNNCVLNAKCASTSCTCDKIANGLGPITGRNMCKLKPGQDGCTDDGDCAGAGLMCKAGTCAKSSGATVSPSLFLVVFASVAASLFVYL